MKPDATNHNPSPVYIRQLVRDTGLTIKTCAGRIGVSERNLYRYMSPEPPECPYSVQFSLEQLKISSEDGINEQD